MQKKLQNTKCKITICKITILQTATQRVNAHPCTVVDRSTSEHSRPTHLAVSIRRHKQRPAKHICPSPCKTGAPRRLPQSPGGPGAPCGVNVRHPRHRGTAPAGNVRCRSLRETGP